MYEGELNIGIIGITEDYTGLVTSLGFVIKYDGTINKEYIEELTKTKLPILRQKKIVFG